MVHISSWIHYAAVFNAIACLHGIILAAIVYRTANKARPANRYLAALILSFSLGLLDALKHSMEPYIYLPHIYFPLEIPAFIYGPILWFYINKIVEPSFALSRRSFLHFIPAICFYVLHLPLELKESNIPSGSIHELHHLSPSEMALFVFLAIIPAYVYTWKCFFLLKRRSRTIQDTYSKIDKISLSWIWTILVIFATLWSLFLFSLLGALSGAEIRPEPDALIQIIFLIVAGVIFVFGYKAMIDQGILVSTAPAIDLPNPQPAGLPQKTEKGRGITDSSKKYEKSSLKPEQAQAILLQLTAAMMNDKLYLDPELTLPQLSARLGIPVHQISQVLNEHRQQNFYRFINGYRIEDAKSRLRESPENRNDKMIAIAFDVGFQSISTFNRVFRELCGVTPSAYRRTIESHSIPDVPPLPL